MKFVLTLAIAVSGWSSANAQQAPPPAPTPKVKTPATVKVEVPAVAVAVPGVTTERSLSVDKKPTVSLCVTSGSVRITGWDRNEVRALVDGGQVGFKIAERSAQSNEPVWVFVTGGDPRGSGKASEECVVGELIEIDVPRAAAVNIKGSPDSTRIDSVMKAKIEVVTGNIDVKNVLAGVSATTYDGAILLERSVGPVSLSTTSGSIVAFEVGQGEPGDVFKAKSQSGAISLQAVLHRQVEVNTISGAVAYRGMLQGGAQYTFNSQNSRVLMNLAGGSSCRVVAWTGMGGFSTDVPLQNQIKTGPTTTGQIGAAPGDCMLLLKTTTGQIRISGEQK